MFDKLQVALSQGLAAGPHGTMPPQFPVFSKPIMNFRGLGAGSRILHSAEDYDRHHTAGHFWMTLLEGPHVSSDVALVDGEPKWWRHATGLATGEGMFDRWTIHAAADPPLEAACGAWIARNLQGFTGILNLETIGGRIIEAHLRLSDQWPDLYGAGWTEAFVGLYRDRVWRYADAIAATGSASCCAGRGVGAIVIRRRTLVREVAAMPGVSSVQITFHEDKPPERHSMPPGRVPGGDRQCLRSGARGGGARGAARAFPGQRARRQRRTRAVAIYWPPCARSMPSQPCAARAPSRWQRLSRCLRPERGLRSWPRTWRPS